MDYIKMEVMKLMWSKE